MYIRYYKKVMLVIDSEKINLTKKLLAFVFVPLFLVGAVFGLIKMNEREALAHPKALLFPLIGAGTFSNDFDSPRSNGPHHATDIIAPKMTKIVAAVGGTLRYVPINQPSWGYMIEIEDAEGFTYDYIHMNNDTPGTDDGNGGPMNAYAPDMKQGYPVAKGQFLGYVGDSGNAESTISHLHFEITAPDGSKINPYPYLLEAQKIGTPATYPALPSEILPYGPSINAMVSMDAGRFETGGVNQLVTGPGPGVSPHVRLLRSNGTEIGGFYAYSPNFQGGVNVAAGDVDGDGIDEIITGTASGSPHVRILKTNGTEVGGFYAFSPSFTGGVNVAAVDIDGDNMDEIIVGAGAGGSPHVRVLKPNGTEVTSFYAYSPDFHGGVDVSGGDVTGTTAKEIVTSPGAGGSAHIRTFNGAGQPIGSGFNAYGSFTGGAHVSVGNARTSSAKDEILVGPWNNGGPHFRLLNYDGSVVSENLYFDSWWDGKYDVAAGNGASYISTGFNRRSSVRPGPH